MALSSMVVLTLPAPSLIAHDSECLKRSWYRARHALFLFPSVPTLCSHATSTILLRCSTFLLLSALRKGSCFQRCDLEILWPSKLVAHVSAEVCIVSATRPHVFASVSKCSRSHHPRIGFVACGPPLLRHESKVHSVTGHGAGRGGEALLLRGV